MKIQMDLMPFYPELSAKHENSNGLNALRIRVPLHVNTSNAYHMRQNTEMNTFLMKKKIRIFWT